MDEIFIEKLVLRVWKTLKDPIRVILIIITIPTIGWLVFSIYHLRKVHKNFILSREYYKSEEYHRIASTPKKNSNKNVPKRLDNNNIEQELREDSEKSQILYNYYSVITYLGNSSILAATLLATEIGVFFAYRWNRKKSAFDTLNSITLGKFLDIRDELESLIDPYNDKTDYLNDRVKFKNENKLIKADQSETNYSYTKKNKFNLIRDVLNTFDLISTGVKYGVIDEEIAYEQLRFVMFAYWRWSRPYILLARMFSVNSSEKAKCYNCNTFYEFEKLMYKWKRRDRLIPNNINFEVWKDHWKDSMREDVKVIFEEARGNKLKSKKWWQWEKNSS